MTWIKGKSRGSWLTLRRAHPTVERHARRGDRRAERKRTTMWARQTCDRPRLRLHHAPVEIERKFLVANDGWKRSVVGSATIRDGLIAAYKDRKVRVRIQDAVATITIKGPRCGLLRAEYEYEIPLAEAESILSTLCGSDAAEKKRFFVAEAGATWQVDVYGGALAGVVIAEIELERDGQDLVLPPWIGGEITGDVFYKKINMLARRASHR
jgi:CYTH domain-containing protein